MSNLVPFSQAKPPSRVSEFFADSTNIGPKNSVNQLSFRGKVWRVVIDGVETVLKNKDDDPISVVHVVVLDHNKSRSRAYYEHAWEEGKSQAPSCWSTNGEVPDATVANKQAQSCATCEMSKKGSKITDAGKETTACSQFKRIVVVPLGASEFPPLLMKLPQTSLWDKNNEENESKGYYSWDQYVDMLRSRGANHTAQVATKIRFDSRVAHPKLVFAASKWLDDDEVEVYGPMTKDPAISKMLQAPENVVAHRDTKDDETTEPAVAAVKPAKAAAAPAKKAEDFDDDDVPPAPKKAKAAPADDDEEAPPPKKAKAAPVADDEEAPPPKKVAPRKLPDDDEEAPPKIKTATMEEVKARVPERKKVVKEEEAPAKSSGKGIDALVGEWNDD